MRNDKARSTEIADRRLAREPRSRRGRWDSVTPGAVEAAKAAIQWRTTDSELAELAKLVEPPLACHPAQMAPRGPRPMMLSFQAAALDVDIDVIPSDGRRRLVGQLAPPRSGPVEVHHSGGSLRVEADDVGRFSVEGVEPGPVSIRCEPHEGGGGPVVETDWFLV
jgi:hypothetical protein